MKISELLWEYDEKKIMSLDQKLIQRGADPSRPKTQNVID
jgi:hypothetical protein